MATLAKQPETELEYWGGIESLGEFIWRMSHDLAHGRIGQSAGVTGDIDEAIAEQKRLVNEIAEKFGVVAEWEGVRPPPIHSHEVPDNYPPAPPGKRWYWPWYQAMMIEAWRPDYEGSVCGACPYCRGGLIGFARSGSLPCELFRGMLNRLWHPTLCAVIRRLGSDWEEYTEEQFLAKLGKEHGAEAKVKWLAHREKLRQPA
jgi:hypothetical protein